MIPLPRRLMARIPPLGRLAVAISGRPLSAWRFLRDNFRHLIADGAMLCAPRSKEQGAAVHPWTPPPVRPGASKLAAPFSGHAEWVKPRPQLRVPLAVESEAAGGPGISHRARAHRPSGREPAGPTLVAPLLRRLGALDGSRNRAIGPPAPVATDPTGCRPPMVESWQLLMCRVR